MPTRHNHPKMTKPFFLDWTKGVGLEGVPDGEQSVVKYTKQEFLVGKPWIDYPDHQIIIEETHLNPMSDNPRGRGAQLFSEDELNRLFDILKQQNAILFVVSNRMTSRVMFEGRYFDEDGDLDKAKSYQAWLDHIKLHSDTTGWYKKWHPLTEHDKHIRALRDETRRDACEKIDLLASRKYGKKNIGTEDKPTWINDDPDVNAMSKIIAWGMENERVSPAMIEDREISLKFKNKPHAYWTFNYGSGMALYYIATKDGKFRTDKNGNFLGIKTLLFDIIQSHAFHAGKGSGAACRAKLKHDRMKAEENAYRKKHKIQTINGGFQVPIPEVRKRHESVNKEWLRLIRDYKLWELGLCLFPDKDKGRKIIPITNKESSIR